MSATAATPRAGTIDIEKALSEGQKAFEPGLLAKANRGILYVDEVNLLDDNLVDVVLDSAAGGVNTVEREGVSIAHPAKFIMIGSGNPAEGEMRPQLLDRFGLAVNVGTLVSTEERLQMVLDRVRYDEGAEALLDEAQADMDALRTKIEAAQRALRDVQMTRELKIKVATVCSELGIDGLRGDLVVNRAARALVAFEARKEVRRSAFAACVFASSQELGDGGRTAARLQVTAKDIQRVLGVCLNHRLRKDVLDDIDSGLKVQLAWRAVTDPAAAERARVAKEQAAKKEADAAAEAPQKKGAWGGLPV